MNLHAGTQENNCDGIDDGNSTIAESFEFGFTEHYELDEQVSNDALPYLMEPQLYETAHF